METTIDIINYTSEQYAELSDEQLLEIKRVQLSKNRLTRRLEENKKKARFRLIENGTFTETTWECIREELEKSYTQEVDSLREGLLFFLQYGHRGETTESVAPYLVDYSLSGEERAIIVRDYYMNTYSSAVARYAEFRDDAVAKRYLGEYYAGLHDYLKNLMDLEEAGNGGS